MNTYATFILKEPNVTKHMSYLHDKYVVVFKDKVQNNICVCKVNVAMEAQTMFHHEKII